MSRHSGKNVWVIMYCRFRPDLLELSITR